MELISNHSKIAGHKIKVQKSTAFLYTSNEQFILETKKHNTIYISRQKRKKSKKYLGTKQINYIQDLQEENYKILKKSKI